MSTLNDDNWALELICALLQWNLFPCDECFHEKLRQLGLLVCVSCIWHPSLIMQYAFTPSSQH